MKDELIGFIDHYIKKMESKIPTDYKYEYTERKIKATITDLKNLKVVIKFRSEDFTLENLKTICDEIYSRNFATSQFYIIDNSLKKYVSNNNSF